MTLRGWLLDGGFFAVMGLLIWGYFVITRRMQRERDEAIRAAAIRVAVPERPRDLIPGSGRRGAPRSLDQVVSVRFTTPALTRIRQLAEAAGVTVSDWIRRGAEAAVWDAEQPAPLPDLGRIVGWSCPHITMTSLPGVLGVPVTGCGCEMHPLYENTSAVAA